MARAAELSLAEGTCLVLVTQGAEHGWAIGSLLAPEAELGTIWSLSRPLTYRAIEQLVERKLIARSGTEEGRGRDRSILRATAAGNRAASAWLASPAVHLRDLRTELLMKLALRRRGGLEIHTLLDAQETALGAALDALSARRGDDDVVSLWRQENARAVRRFLRRARDLGSAAAASGETVRSDVRLSARNQLRVTIDSVQHGGVMASVKAALPDGQRLTAAITSDAVDELDLAAGDEVLMIVKSTEIMVAKP
ncbi:MAG: hypothetical protein RL219_2536 [Actinomycetota bacterium]|jgi:PadR family transcriptional regulator AphA